MVETATWQSFDGTWNVGSFTVHRDEDGIFHDYNTFDAASTGLSSFDDAREVFARVDSNKSSAVFPFRDRNASTCNYFDAIARNAAALSI